MLVFEINGPEYLKLDMTNNLSKGLDITFMTRNPGSYTFRVLYRKNPISVVCKINIQPEKQVEKLLNRIVEAEDKSFDTSLEYNFAQILSEDFQGVNVNDFKFLDLIAEGKTNYKNIFYEDAAFKNLSPKKSLSQSASEQSPHISQIDPESGRFISSEQITAVNRHDPKKLDSLNSSPNRYPKVNLTPPIPIESKQKLQRDLSQPKKPIPLQRISSFNGVPNRRREKT